MTLPELGWCDAFEEAFRLHAEAGLLPARVVAHHRGGYRIVTPSGEFQAEVSGRFRHQTRQTSDYPVVGDWVAMGMAPDGNRAVIQAVLPRRTKFSRNAAGDATEEQMLAANIDLVFIVESLAQSLNTRRIERYLALAWESGAQPVVLLTKSDLCEHLQTEVTRGVAAAGGVPVHAVCSLTGQGMDAVLPHLGVGCTAVLLGPSGVGKSTLVNHLAGEEVQWVLPVRETDQKGRHTTTHRELIPLPRGGFIIDTPGLRELQLWDAAEGVSESFADIEELARQCRFTNCLHDEEPGCAVTRAIGDGNLDGARLESFRKLAREAEHFERRHDARARADERRRWKGIAKSLRVHKKNRGKD